MSASTHSPNSKHWFTTFFLWRKVPESDARSELTALWPESDARSELTALWRSIRIAEMKNSPNRRDENSLRGSRINVLSLMFTFSSRGASDTLYFVRNFINLLIFINRNFKKKIEICTHKQSSSFCLLPPEFFFVLRFL